MQTKRTRSFLVGMSTLGVRSGHREEVLVDGGIVGEFGMKGSGEKIIFLDKCGLAGMAREHIDAGTNAFDDRATDENHFERIFFQGARAEENIAGELAAIAVAEDGHVEKAERRLRRIVDMSSEEDCAGTGAEDGVTGVGEFADGVVQAFFAEKLQLRGGFAAGKDEAVAGFEIVDGAHLDGVRAEGLQSGGVGGEVTLDSEDADFHGAWNLKKTKSEIRKTERRPPQKAAATKGGSPQGLKHIYR
jgi:hypothetical protein